ncbi:MAG: methionine adenosyltransferase [Candidatus Omnitrophica bacterium]|nr:methionine adenosyltransferase [Candidatus Omnitrophota bacterium]
MTTKPHHLFTSESVTEGHPDKIADQISDAILDAILKDDPQGRVACETLVTTGLTVVAGEVTTSCYVEIPKIVRETIHQIGYNDPDFGYHWENSGVLTAVQGQSPDIALGVDAGGAGDQGMMFGYATHETPEYMPMPILLSHKLARRLAEIRKDGTVNYLRPDGKSQVTIEYHDGKPARVEAIVLGAHHGPKVTTPTLRADLKALVIEAVIPKHLMDKKTKVFINATGRFEVGGPMADTGVTGRKIIVDTYGGVGRHGGGAFSGKDPTKVDRSASYAARWVAKTVVAAGLADRCEIQLAYVIGVRDPVSIMATTFGTGKVSDDAIVRAIREVFDLTPSGIIRDLKLRRPIFTKTAAYGHFGRNEPGFTWEELDRVDAVRRAVGWPAKHRAAGNGSRPHAPAAHAALRHGSGQAAPSRR